MEVVLDFLRAGGWLVASAASGVGLLLLVWEVADFLQGQTGRPRWWRRPVCWLLRHDRGFAGDEPTTTTCLRCGAALD